MSAIGLGWLYVGWRAVLFETNYGLMQQSPIEIKERLLKALDKEYNVRIELVCDVKILYYYKLLAVGPCVDCQCDTCYVYKVYFPIL